MLQAAVDTGQWAERLSVNSDWLEFRKIIMSLVEKREAEKFKNYDILVRGSLSTDDKLKAVDSIREMDMEIENFKTVMRTPDDLAKAGREAQAQLDEMSKPKEEK